GFVDRADHVERLFGQVIVVAVHDAVEAADRLRQLHVLAGRAREGLGDEKRLRQEALNLSRPGNRQLVVFGEFVHAEDRDDVLQFLVALQHCLHTARAVVMFLANDVRVQHPAGGVERVHRGIDAEFGDLPRQDERGIEVSKGRRRRGVGEVVRRYVNRLERGDRTGLGRGDAFLQYTHFLGQRRLVTHRGGHAPEQGGYFRSGQGVAVNVVDEHQYVAAFITERFRHGQPGQRDAQAVTRRLVHLPIHQRYLVDNAGVGHLVVKVVAFAGAFADAREYGIAGMFRGDVPDQLHQRYGLADAGAAEQADLAALGDGHDQVDDLDAGFQQLRCGRLVFIGRCLPVDRHGCLGADVALVVDGIPEYVHDAPERLLPDRYRDVLARIADAHATLQAFAGTHGDGAYDPVAELLLYLERDAGFIDHQRVVNLGDRVAWKLHVNHAAED